jgi:hypothetical protein
MRLADLNPKFLGAGGPGIFNSLTGEQVPAQHGVGVDFDCPCGSPDCCRLFVRFANPIDGTPYTAHPAWHRTGETFDTLTLEPSIQRIVLHRQDGTPVNCGWHGWIRNGEVIPA